MMIPNRRRRGGGNNRAPALRALVLRLALQVQLHLLALPRVTLNPHQMTVTRKRKKDTTSQKRKVGQPIIYLHVIVVYNIGTILDVPCVPCMP